MMRIGVTDLPQLSMGAQLSAESAGVTLAGEGSHQKFLTSCLDLMYRWCRMDGLPFTTLFK